MELLYKKDFKGNIRVLKIYSNDNIIIKETGILGGKLIYHNISVSPKNIGKKNETSIEQQIELEINSLINKHIQEGYSYNIEEDSIILPMLAKNYSDIKSKIDRSNCYVQPKLDGMRCLVFISKGNIKLVSRKGVEILTVPHIVNELLTVIKKGDEYILDGELYCHGKTFQENMSLIKKNTDQSINIKYHIYDMIGELSFINRYNELPIRQLDFVNIVSTNKINNEDELNSRHGNNIIEGYEGSIIRWGNEGYKNNSRSNNLLKYKDFIDESFIIIDIVPMEQYSKQGLIVCKDSNGNIFKATPKLSHKEKEDLLLCKNNYIGQIAEIRFFEYTDGGLPRFPICVGFRLDK